MSTRQSFRIATHADIEAVVALVESAYRGDASRAGWTTEADLLDGQRTDTDGVRTLIDDDATVLLIAEQEESLAACCYLRREGDRAHFGMFSVVPALQAQGVGRAMLAEAERLAREIVGVREIQMTVIDCREELIAWYERRGYVRTGEHAPFPYGNARFGLPRRDDLRFETLRKELPGSLHT